MIETIQINGQSYTVDEEVAGRFSKFINKAKRDRARIKELESLNFSYTGGWQMVRDAEYNDLVKVISGDK